MLTVYQGNPIRDSLSAILTTPGSSPIGNLGHLFRPQIQEKLQQISSLDAFDFNLKVDAGEKYAEKAQQHYVDRINRHDENTPWHEKAADWAGGTLSSLWTCENSDKTLAVLGTALGAGRSTGASGLDDAARGLRNSSDNVQRATKNTDKVPQPKACFVAGTEIETPDGEKNIEDIKVGDLVIADDPTTPGEIESKRVEETFVRHTDEIVDLYVDAEVISTTNEHPFWIPNIGWVKAQDLQVGSKLQTEDGTVVDIDQIEKREGDFTVYNFKVEDFHTYFISELGILVHNANYGDKIYIPDPEKYPLLQQNINGQDIPLPDPQANGLPHTTLGGKVGSDGNLYRQSATFPGETWPKANGQDVPWGRVDWSDHGRPFDHPNPHIHEFSYDTNQKAWKASGEDARKSFFSH